MRLGGSKARLGGLKVAFVQFGGSKVCGVKVN